MLPQPNNRRLSFTASEVHRLFGPEAAEDEDPERLKEYYFKSGTYTNVTADLPLRVLVGHKGIGKSALFKMAMLEDRENGELPILIRPDDIAGIAKDSNDFLLTIRAWRTGLNEIITRKVLSEFGLDQSGAIAQLQNVSGRVLDFIVTTVQSLKPLNYEPTRQLMLNKFLKENKITVYIDDLDRGWEGRREDVRRISALLNAIRDMANESRGLDFKIGLRSDVYYLVRTSDAVQDMNILPF
jgi:hypothetical protein